MIILPSDLDKEKQRKKAKQSSKPSKNHRPPQKKPAKFLPFQKSDKDKDAAADIKSEAKRAGQAAGEVASELAQKTGAELKSFWTFERIIILIIVVAVVAWVAMTIQVLNNNYKLQRQVDNANLDNQITELQNENLKLEQKYYQTDEYLELSARSLLGKALPGEHMVILPKVAHTDNNNEHSGRATVTKSNLDQWLDFLFGEHDT